MPLQTIPVRDLGGGVNDFNLPSNIDPSEMQNTSRNVRGMAEYCVQRPGYVTFADLLTGNTTGIRWLAPYFADADVDDRLFMVYGTTMYLVDPTVGVAWTAITDSNFTNGDNVTTETWGGWLFVFNGVDQAQKIAGTTATQPFVKPDSLSASSDFTPAFGKVYTGSLFVSGVAAAPNVVYTSKASTSATQEDVYDFSGAIATAAEDANELLFNNRVTAIQNMSTACVIFLVDGAWYVPGIKDLAGGGYDYERQPIGGAYGAVSQKATCVVNNDIYYITPNKQIRSVRRDISNNQQSMITFPLSKKIQKFLDEEIDDDLSSAFCYFNPQRREVYFHFRLKGDVNNFIRITGNMDRIDAEGCPAWYIDDNMPMNCGCVMNGKAYNGSAVQGQVFEDGVGNADDDDSAIVSKRVSKEFIVNDNTLLKNWKGVHLWGNISQSTSKLISVYCDDVLVDQETITITANPANSQIGGIGTEEVGNFEIGDEEEDTTPNQTDLFEYFKRIPLRKRAKKIVVVSESDGTNNEYQDQGFNIFLMPQPSFQYPVSERSN